MIKDLVTDIYKVSNIVHYNMSSQSLALTFSHSKFLIEPSSDLWFDQHNQPTADHYEAVAGSDIEEGITKNRE